jgi:hypothetical protein
MQKKQALALFALSLAMYGVALAVGGGARDLLSLR